METKYDLVVGTTWLFADPLIIATPVDVLLIDEAGQLSLADTLAASCGAKNLVLLGHGVQSAPFRGGDRRHVTVRGVTSFAPHSHGRTAVRRQVDPSPGK